MITREFNDVLSNLIQFGYEHAAISANTTIKLRTFRAPARIERVEYDNPTGFATVSGTDFWTINILKSATVVATWNTSATVAGVSGAIPVDTLFDLVNSATDVNRVFGAPGDAAFPLVFSLQFVKTGAPANLPLGRIFVHALTV